jgi:HSP20 family protein
MALMKWNPFEEFASLEDRLARLWEGFPFGSVERSRGKRQVADWIPPVDIFEDENAYLVKVELPDLSEKDVELKIDNDVLTISGRKKLEREDKKSGYHLIESSYGEFSRSFSLPSNVEGEKATAKFEKGVLKVTLPKKPESKPKHISIKLN